MQFTLEEVMDGFSTPPSGVRFSDGCYSCIPKKAVNITPQGVFIREKRINVSRRIHHIEAVNPGSFIIYFNPLYQLRVFGSAPRIQDAWEMLALRFPATQCRVRRPNH